VAIWRDTPRGKAFTDKLAKKHLAADEFKKVNRYTFTGYAGANARPVRSHGQVRQGTDMGLRKQ
jgi:Icc-related predicted phosphoesterase